MGLSFIVLNGKFCIEKKNETWFQNRIFTNVEHSFPLDGTIQWHNEIILSEIYHSIFCTLQHLNNARKSDIKLFSDCLLYWFGYDQEYIISSTEGKYSHKALRVPQFSVRVDDLLMRLKFLVAARAEHGSQGWHGDSVTTWGQ